MAMADTAGARGGRFTTGTMFAASMHILATWIAVESDYTDIAANVKNVSEQLRRIVESHVDDPFVKEVRVAVSS
jgi:hypothetical protein